MYSTARRLDDAVHAHGLGLVDAAGERELHRLPRHEHAADRGHAQPARAQPRGLASAQRWVHC